jgi:DNA-binding GntR family transcriptional regulator
VSRSHRRILHAIEAGDAEAARRRTERDITAYASHLEALFGRAAGA